MPEPISPLPPAGTPACGHCGSPLLAACPGCGSAMPGAFRFCGYCGTPLQPPCAACGAAVPAGFRYCGLCGAPYEGGAALPRPVRPVPQPAAVPAPAAPAAEQRRRVAILFADLSGSTALADRLEAEASFRVVSECLAGLGRIVTEQGGYVVKTLGDGLMALFGAPVALGDDPERAARAGLALQEWMAEYGAEVERRHGSALRLRVGINYGSVVAAPISTGDREEYDVLGDAVNVAQRVESAAEVGTVCVSEPFYRVTRRAFEYLDRGAARVKGKPEPIQLYRLVGPRPEGEASGALLPLVGRDSELARLREAGRDLVAGEGGVLALVGAGGMGKTRLLEELYGEVVGQGLPCLVGTGVEGDREAPLRLWREWLLELLPMHPGMGHGEAVGALRETLGEGAAPWAEWLAALALEPDLLVRLEPDARERTLRAAVRAFLDHWRAGRPAALLVDEAGLLDSLTLSLLLDAGSGILVGLAGRENEAYPPVGAPALTLGPLRDDAVRTALVEAVPELEEDTSLLARSVERAGGQPLFLDLMLRAAREAADPLAVLASVPDHLYGLVQAQLDRLPPAERATVQRAAVLGKSFAERWLERLLSEREPLTAARPWRSLERRAVLVERRPDPQRELAFRHGALQEVAYEGLLGAERQEEHARSARLLEAEGRSELAARIAGHWTRAGEDARALPWLLRAAEQAAALYEGEEARSLFRRAQETAERLERPEELARAAAGLAAILAHGGELAAAVELYERAAASLSREGEPPPVLAASVARGHARILGTTGELSAAEPLLRRALDLLAGRTDPEALRERCRCLTEAAHLELDQGRAEMAARLGQEALALADAGGWDAEAVAAGNVLGRVYPALGDWPAAERELRRAAERAQDGGDWQGAAACLINLGVGLQNAGRLAEAERSLLQAAELAERIGDEEKGALIRLNLGTVRLNAGDWPGADSALREALARFQVMEHGLGVAVALYNLADTARWDGRLAEAVETLSAAEAAVRLVEAPPLAAHVEVTRAEVLLARGQAEEAAAAASHAHEVAGACEYGAGVHLAQLVRGRALAASGAGAAAEAELRAALAGFESGGSPLEGARTRAELASLLSGDGRAEEARALRARAEAELEHLGATPWLAHFPAVREFEGSGTLEPHLGLT